MPVSFAYPCTALGGGTGGQPFEDVPGVPHVLVGMRFDCHPTTDHVDEYPTWTIYYNFLNAIIPMYAELQADGTLSAPVPGTQRGSTGFTEGCTWMAPIGYVITGINVRWDTEQDSGRTSVKALQFVFAKWTPQGVSATDTAASEWQGGDGQIPAPLEVDIALTPANNLCNAPPITTSGGSIQLSAAPGACMIGLVGRCSDMIDALGGVYALPRIPAR